MLSPFSSVCFWHSPRAKSLPSVRQVFCIYRREANVISISLGLLLTSPFWCMKDAHVLCSVLNGDVKSRSRKKSHSCVCKTHSCCAVCWQVVGDSVRRTLSGDLGECRFPRCALDAPFQHTAQYCNTCKRKRLSCRCIEDSHLYVTHVLMWLAFLCDLHSYV